jgi:hypothetical protein
MPRCAGAAGQFGRAPPRGARMSQIDACLRPIVPAIGHGTRVAIRHTQVDEIEQSRNVV